MKVFVMDTDGEGSGVDIAMRAKRWKHDVRYWLPTETSGEIQSYGEGLLERPEAWKASLEWADLTILTGNSTFQSSLAEYFGRGYPIFGSNPKASELELDRGVGQSVLEFHGVEVPDYEIAESPEEAIKCLTSSKKPLVMKPWGGDADKAMTCVPRTIEEGIFHIKRWQKEGKFKGQLMMQEKVEGIEMGVAGWFGPGGWSAALEESWEHKKFLVGDLGENTGEMGTIIRYCRKSKLFDEVLEPITDYLHKINYIGDCDVNCIIDEKGKPRPLEFTMRLGWPDYCIRQELQKGDPVQWMLDLIEGKDTLEFVEDTACGVVLAHGDFPKGKDPAKVWSGYPINGVSADNLEHLHFQQMMMGKGWTRDVKEVPMLTTAGTYVMVVSGKGKSTSKAIERCYETVDEIKWPGNMMYRTDIGSRLKEQLPILQKHGYAQGMKF